jgi:two-component system KDP operon response regulator KdpE
VKGGAQQQDEHDVTSILVVDDDPQVVRVLRITLAAYGYTVLTASDGRAALRRAAECPPAAIVLDCGLPDMDGIEVITQLRRWSGVPIMVFSARSSRADQERALRAGADAYVTKPASVSQLVGQLQAVLHQAQGAALPAGTDLARGTATPLGTGHEVS